MDITGALVRHVAFPIWVRKNRSERLNFLRAYEQSQFAPAEVIRQRQWADFKRIVTHAYQSAAFYRRKFEAIGLTPEDLRSPDDVAHVPTTSKLEIQESLQEMIAKSARPESMIRDMTGGSTGSPMVFYYDAVRRDRRVAATIRHNSWAGWNLGDRAAALWGAPRDTRAQLSVAARIRNSIIDRLLVLDASAIDECQMREFAHRLQRYRPAAILGYANTLGLFARFVEQEGIRGIRPRGIVSSAELLTTENRAVIESAFGCKVYDRYGSREVGIIASQCGAHEGMHVSAESLLVEGVTGTSVNSEGDGEIVITDLQNFVMPMIRYRTMDVGRILRAIVPAVEDCR